MIKKLLNKLLDRLPEIAIVRPAMKLVLAVIGVYAVLISLFILGLSYNAWQARRFDLGSIIEMVRVLLGPSAIAAVAFLGKAFIDANHDGIPDAFETPAEEDRPGRREKDC